MSLVGVHITFSDMAQGLAQSPALLPYRATGSQYMNGPGTSTVVAVSHGNSQPLLSISASAPIFYAVGPAPDPINGPRRYYDPSFGREDLFCDPGDTFAWILAGF
jgi:hypothetical protein